MTEFEKFEVGFMPTNCYLLYDEKQEEAVLVDPGGGMGKILDFLARKGKKVGAILLTHGHFDHIMDVAAWHEKGVPVYLHEEEEEFLFDGELSMTYEVGADLPPVKDAKTFRDGDKLVFGAIELTVIHTPGHTRGSCCFIVDSCARKTILSGDTLFCETYGNVGFPTGSKEQMERSLKEVLFGLEDDYLVLPGHEESTTLKHEKEFNSILYL